MSSVNHAEPGLAKHTYAKLCRHRRRRLFTIRHPDVLMEKFSKKGLKIFVEKGEVEQM